MKREIPRKSKFNVLCFIRRYPKLVSEKELKILLLSLFVAVLFFMKDLHFNPPFIAFLFFVFAILQHIFHFFLLLLLLTSTWFHVREFLWMLNKAQSLFWHNHLYPLVASLFACLARRYLLFRSSIMRNGKFVVCRKFMHKQEWNSFGANVNRSSERHESISLEIIFES